MRGEQSGEDAPERRYMTAAEWRAIEEINASPAMTDRECLIAVFKGVAALYHAVTNQPLVVRVETAAGSVTISDDGGGSGAASGPTGDLPGLRAMRPPSPTLPRATPPDAQ